MWRHYIYIHRRESDNVIFYVGKGAARKRDKVQHYERASVERNANKHWLNIVNKHGLIVEIIMSCFDDIEAQCQEKKLISEIGRLDLGQGSLINKTDGGDGHAGILISEELRLKRKINSAGKLSDAWTNSIRIARKNGGNGGVVKKGDKLPDSWRSNLSKSKLGNKNPWFGKSSPAAKLVLNLETGMFYNSVNDAAIAHCINPKTLYQYLDGSRVNLTSLVRV